MKFVLVFFAVLAVALAADTKYTDRWDNIDIDQILTSKRLLKNYVDCLMERGTCNNDGRKLKELLPDALATDCEKCTPAQKEKSEKIIRFLVNQRKEIWDELAAKYDPKNIYRVKYQDQAKEKGIEV